MALGLVIWAGESLRWRRAFTSISDLANKFECVASRFIYLAFCWAILVFKTGIRRSWIFLFIIYFHVEKANSN